MVENVGAGPVDYATYGTTYNPIGVRPQKNGATPEETYPFQGRIAEGGPFPPAAGRYHLFVSHACPYAQRTLIVRALKGLEDVVGASILDPLRDGRGWAFRPVPGATLDQSGAGFAFLSEAYHASVEGGDYRGRVSVPVLWDTQSGRIVSNYFPTITLDLGSAFNKFATQNQALDLYPVQLQPDLDNLIEDIYSGLNTGVYAAGFPGPQSQHDAAAKRVWETLATLEERLSDGRTYLFGDALTEADVRLFPTLVRFDAVYHHHFKLIWRRVQDYPRLWAYTRRLFALPAFGGTTNLDHIVRHYYGTQLHVNPSGVVPSLPDIDWTVDKPAKRSA
ncbi:MAG: glutathione S-transferase C-terminal domain-containing protein [Propionibacteriaceae bacterium]|nr:glutathione S-transferase C-terminal domain-containing protein [Propionibacteriaceae bacterium]